MNVNRLPVVLIAEDDLGNRALLQEAFQASGTAVDLRFVASGEEFLDYLHFRPPWEKAHRPDLIVLDLNTPHTSGREALRVIKADRKLRAIPVLVLTTSMAAEDILDAYENGASTYIRKSDSPEELANSVRVLCEFWFKVGVLPVTAKR